MYVEPSCASLLPAVNLGLFASTKSQCPQEENYMSNTFVHRAGIVCVLFVVAAVLMVLVTRVAASPSTSSMAARAPPILLRTASATMAPTWQGHRSRKQSSSYLPRSVRKHHCDPGATKHDGRSLSDRIGSSELESFDSAFYHHCYVRPAGGRRLQHSLRRASGNSMQSIA